MNFPKLKETQISWVGLIQEKTGAARREIEEFLDEVISNGETIVQNVTERPQIRQQASEVVRDQYDRVGRILESGYEDARDMVRARPAESVGVAFAAGWSRAPSSVCCCGLGEREIGDRRRTVRSDSYDR